MSRVTRIPLLWIGLLLGPAAGAWGGSISGTVVESATGRPLARTRIVLETRSVSNPVERGAALSGPGGEFSFPGLPAGVYLLRAERKGYATARHGQRRFDEPGTPIVLDESGYFSVQLRLRRLGAITGRVADENQVGLEEFRVFAYAAGRRRRLVAAAETDDRGIYRLRGLRPGRYLVRTAARQIEGGQGLLPTWFGQTVSIAGARAVEVELDGEAAGVDITPAPGQPGTLSGRIAGGSASQVLLAGETGPRAAKVDGGRFDFGPVEPGRYALVVDPAAAGGQAAAYQEVTVGEGAASVVLELKRAPVLTVACGGARGERIDPRGVSVFLKRKELDEDPQRVLCGETSVRGPGTWEIAAAPPPQYYVASFTEAAGGDEVFEFLLQPGESRRVDVALGTDPASLSGTVRTSDGEPAIGAPVFLAAQDADLERRLGGVKSTRADAAGSFRFAGLAPGRYEAVASYQVREPVEENWPGGRGEVVVLENGREKTQDLRVIVLE